MATRVILPKQGLQMTEGTITSWLIAEGQKVEADQSLFEMETDKVNIEIGAPASGTLLKIIRNVGEVVPITELIAVIGEPGEDISELLQETSTAAVVDGETPEPANNDTTALEKETAVANRPKGERVFISPRAKMAADEAGISYEDINGTGADGLIIERDVKEYIAKLSERPKATPLAQKVAQLNDVNLEQVQGSGSRGKIMKADIEAAVAARIAGTLKDTRKGYIVPFSGMRKAIADNMMKSLHGMVQANHRMKVDLTEVIRFRDKLKADGITVSFNDILVKIVAKALLDIPVMNSSLTDEGIHIKDYVNLGMAVAVENGLIVPVIKDADLLSLREISLVSAELIDKAKNGKLQPDEYKGGTFTITNLGMFDIDEFTAVINPPEAGILAVGKIDRVPVVEGESIVIKPVMMLSLTYDHRIVDGAPAAQFLQRVKQIMQNPYLLI
ncbi:MAG: dihydrolipoamide acetyltransferase family protein [Desulfitobacteriaceae bacterium]